MEASLKRISDLFVEGTEAYLGDDEHGVPVVIWMNKLNSFEDEEALRDAQVRRAERIAELTEDSPEVRGARAEIAMWSDEELLERIIMGEDDSITVEAFQNLQTQEDWNELEDYVRRAPMLMDDETLKPGDPRFQTLGEKTGEYTRRLRDEVEKVRRERLDDIRGLDREVLERKFMEDWRTRVTTEEWSGARRTTELFLAARDCHATMAGGGRTLAGEIVWDHSACDHSKRFFTERASVRRLPDGAMRKVVDAYESLRISARDSGNSDAPASSSGSSEPSSAPEEASSPSFQEGTLDAAPTV